MTHEQTSKTPISEATPEQLASHMRLRTSVAELMAPCMFEGLELASYLAGTGGLHDPESRYEVLQTITMKLFNAPQSRREFAERYEDYADQFKTTKEYGRIYDQYFPSLARAAIKDVHWLGLSAAHKLECVGHAAESSDIIPRSVGLLAVTRADKHGILKLRDDLGSPIDPDYMTVVSSDFGDSLAFTPEAQDLIDKYPSQFYGCPAFALKPPEQLGIDDSLLNTYWQAASTYAFAQSTSRTVYCLKLPMKSLSLRTSAWYY